jgi:predicted ArsR family transcriptional regulator
MRWWEKQVGGETRGRIIALLRRGVETVDALAAELGVTDNAVRAQLQALEREGMVAAIGTRAPEGAGKPATRYAVAPVGESVLSAAYAPVLTALLGTLRDRLPAAEVDALLRETGQRLGAAARASGSLADRVRDASLALTALGGEVDVERTAQGYRLCGHACPLSAAVRVEPHACHAVEELLTSIVGRPVRESCDRAGRPRCRFEIVA